MKLTRYEIIPAGLMFLAIMILSAIMWTPRAHAQMPSCYVGGSLNGQIASVKEDSVTFSDKGVGYGVLAGCQIGLGSLDVGGRLGYDWTKHEAHMGSWHAAGILGWRLNEHVRPYALLGVTGVDVDANFKGIVGGAGLEIALAKQLAATIEYNRVWLDARTIEDVKVKPSIDVIRLGLVYKLF